MVRDADDYLFQRDHYRIAEVERFNWQTNNCYVRDKELALIGDITEFKCGNILEVGCGEGANIYNLRKINFNKR